MASPYVAVIGAGRATEAESRLARAVGMLLAREGAVLVSGGRTGVMHASCEGAFRAGGTTVGLLPEADRSGANPYLSVALATGLGQMRNGLVIAAADAVIAIGGGWGTLSEIALAMRAGKPVVALATWEARAPQPTDHAPVSAGSPEEAVRLALAAVAG